MKPLLLVLLALPVFAEQLPVSIRMESGRPVVTVQGVWGYIATLEASTDLEHWEVICQQELPESGALTFTDGYVAKRGRRFYRASQEYP